MPLGECLWLDNSVSSWKLAQTGALWSNISEAAPLTACCCCEEVRGLPLSTFSFERKWCGNSIVTGYIQLSKQNKRYRCTFKFFCILIQLWTRGRKCLIQSDLRLCIDGILHSFPQWNRNTVRVILWWCFRCGSCVGALIGNADAGKQHFNLEKQSCKYVKNEVSNWSAKSFFWISKIFEYYHWKKLLINWQRINLQLF